MTDEKVKADEKNQTVKIAVDEITKENVRLKDENQALQVENDELKKNLQETNAFLDSEVRAKLGADLRKISKFTVEDIDKMPTQDLKVTLDTLQHSNLIRKPMIPANTAEDNAEHFTVGSLFGQPLRSKGAD